MTASGRAPRPAGSAGTETSEVCSRMAELEKQIKLMRVAMNMLIDTVDELSTEIQTLKERGEH